MTTAVQIKRCTKCSKDLTGIKRLKDAKGKYWCPECGVDGVPAAGSSLVSPCPRCHAPVHAAQLIRDPKTGTYICQNCANGVKPKGGAAPVVNEEAAKQKKMIIVACVMIVMGVVAFFVLNSVLG